MHTKTRLKLLALAIVILTLAAGTSPSDLVVPPPPLQLPPTGNCYADNVFYGAIPPGGENGRVLVFVHGLSGLAEDWWSVNLVSGINDMYTLAYNAGYRTAFVNVNVDLNTPGDCTVVRRPASAVMGSGFVLGQQLAAITQHYGVGQVDIVAHSKGGLDAEAALVWWDGWRYVRHVFTLGTPHQGSLLADLLWSPEGFWVGALLGQRDDATFSLQTAMVQLFRSVTDPNPVDDATRYYTGAGNFWQTPGTLYPLTGQWLQDNPDGGDNDGVVDVTHTYLPGATTLFLQPWNHAEVYLGRNAFPYIHQILLNDEASRFKIHLPLVMQSPEAARKLETTGALKLAESNFILRGGRLTGTVSEQIPVEPQARAAKFVLLTTDARITATLSGPDGRRRPLQAMAHTGEGVFASALQWEQMVDQPSPGQWMIRLDGPPGTGYLLVVTLDSTLQVGLDGLPDHPISPGTTVQLAAYSQAPTRLAQVDQIKLRVGRSSRGWNNRDVEEATSGKGGVLGYRFTAEGLYNISATVTGRTTDGFLFERSFVRSLAVALPEKLKDALTISDLVPGH